MPFAVTSLKNNLKKEIKSSVRERNWSTIAMEEIDCSRITEFCFCHKTPSNRPKSPKHYLVCKVKLLTTMKQFSEVIQICHFNPVAIFHLLFLTVVPI